MSATTDRRPPYYLGIDLGGTNIKSGVVDDQGRPLSFVHIETEAELGPEVGLDRLAEVGRHAVEASGLTWDEITAVGLGSPGTMDIQAGLLLDPPNLPGWVNWPIREKLAERLGKPTVLQNDANAAAYGEYWVGAGRDMQSLVLFTLGTGIGAGSSTTGGSSRGGTAMAQECGHIIIQMENARLCSCGKYGHLEAYASATSLVKRAHEALEHEASTLLHQALAEHRLTSQTISEAAETGDPLARRLMRDTARYLAVGAVTLMHTVDPDIILFSGGMIAAGATFLEAIRSDIRAMAFSVPAAKTRVEYAALGGEAGVIGAAGCAVEIRQSLKTPRGLGLGFALGLARRRIRPPHLVDCDEPVLVGVQPIEDQGRSGELILADLPIPVLVHLAEASAAATGTRAPAGDLVRGEEAVLVGVEAVEDHGLAGELVLAHLTVAVLVHPPEPLREHRRASAKTCTLTRLELAGLVLGDKTVAITVETLEKEPGAGELLLADLAISVLVDLGESAAH